MLRVLTGRNYLMEDALCREVERALAATERDQVVIVPRQLTLGTELTLMNRLGLTGSFRLQVLTPQRLCEKIFDAVGAPEGEMIDERGRVLLAREAARAVDGELTLYRGAKDRRGFAQRAARQMEILRQGGMTAQALFDCADTYSGSFALKLRDLGHLLADYEKRVAGRYQDGETAFRLAVAQAGSADFLREARIWFYGFDITPPALTELIAACGGACPDATMFMPLDVHGGAGDQDVFRPILAAHRRLLTASEALGAAVVTEPLPDVPPANREIRLLEREIFACPSHADPSDAPPRSIQLAALRNPREEARFAAALTRRLCQSRGWHYNDVTLLVQDLEGYALPLKEAFEDCDIPLFLSVSRAASRHALAESLLSALRLLSRGWREEDMTALLDTDMTPLNRDEAARLHNYAVKWGVRGRAFLSPFHRGLPEEAAALEPLREKLTAPLRALREALREADGLKAQLAAVYRYLVDSGAYGKCQDRQRALIAAGDRQLAGEVSQVWNRLLGTMDQMAALMGERRVSLKELEMLLTESLDAAQIKPLPQAQDAVYAQSTDSILEQPARAVLVLGLCDRPMRDDEGLLSDAQRRALSNDAKAYLGPEPDERINLRRFHLKSALGMARDYVCASYAISGADGSAQRPGMAVAMLKSIFPRLTARGGVAGDGGLQNLLCATPKAAARLLSGSFSDAEASRKLTALLSGIPEAGPSLGKIGRGLNRSDAAGALDALTARRLYGEITSVSISRLERFAACPFSHFAKYGLRPEVVKPYQFGPVDEGSFLHDATRDFTLWAGSRLGEMSPEEARAGMDEVAEKLLERQREGALGDTAVSRSMARSLKEAAGAVAESLASHMRGSRFSAEALEATFGPEDGDAAPRIAGETGDCALEGRIDRVDAWAEGNALRIIDYKRHGKKMNLWQAYMGLRLQLPLYLAAATRRYGMGSAGVYYFTLDDDILAEQSVDPAAIREARTKKFRLDGLMPAEEALRDAMSPDCGSVFTTRFKATGEPYAGQALATEGDFRRLTDRALKMAGRSLDEIRRGACARSPVQEGERTPCAWCDWKSACLFDPTVDRQALRPVGSASAAEVLHLLAEESGEQEGE